MSTGPVDLVIIAGYPPPRGGVTTHVFRLCQLLRDEGVRFRVLNTVSDTERPPEVISIKGTPLRSLARHLLRPGTRCSYIMSARLPMWCFGALLARLRPSHVVVLRLQNDALVQRLQQRRWMRPLRWIMGSYDAIVAVNAELVTTLEGLGLRKTTVHHIPGFLPPVPIELEVDDPDAAAFLDAHKPAILSSGRVSFRDGADLYGLDLLVELVAILRGDPDTAEAGVLVAFWDYAAADDEYLDTLRRRARELDVADHVRFRTSQGSFVALLDHADLVVRATNTDGDANTIREALAVGVPVVASDVVERPAGSVVFRTGDGAALAAATTSALAGASPASARDEHRAAPYISLIRGWSTTDRSAPRP